MLLLILLLLWESKVWRVWVWLCCNAMMMLMMMAVIPRKSSNRVSTLITSQKHGLSCIRIHYTYINKISNVLISHSRHIRTSFEAYMHGRNFFSFRQLDRDLGLIFSESLYSTFLPLCECVFLWFAPHFSHSDCNLVFGYKIGILWIILLTSQNTNTITTQPSAWFCQNEKF